MFLAVRSLATLVAPWVVYVWAVRAFPWLGSHRGRKRWLAASLIVFVIVDRVSDLMVIHWHSAGAGLVHAAAVVLFTTFILAAVPLGILYALLWAIDRVGRVRRERAHREGRRDGRPGVRNTRRTSSSPPSLPVSSDRSPTDEDRARAMTRRAMTRRQWVEGMGGAAIFGATGSMLGWGMVRGRHAFELTELPLRIPGLPRALDGYVIAQVSDIHSGALVGERELDEGLSLVRAARPDLIVVTGDIVDFDPSYAPIAARKLTDLPARDGVVAVLGNHDYYAGADAVVAALGAAGIDVLRDAGRRIRPGDGGGFALLGVDDLSAAKHGRGGPRLDRALSTVDPDLPRILLSHQPSTIERWAGQVAAQLSGHTHGGQINPGFSPAAMLLKYVAGAYEVGGTKLYVNRGFGTVGAPSRVGAPPEITRIVLVAA
jgi:predicted MPP superfamily phosphohydrolase